MNDIPAPPQVPGQEEWSALRRLCSPMKCSAIEGDNFKGNEIEVPHQSSQGMHQGHRRSVGCRRSSGPGEQLVGIPGHLIYHAFHYEQAIPWTLLEVRGFF